MMSTKRQKLINPIDKVFTDRNLTTYHIIPYLSPLNVWALYLAYPRLVSNTSFLNRFMEVLHNHLKRKNCDINIHDENLALTGGLLVGILYNEYNEESDIDLLCTENVIIDLQRKPIQIRDRQSYYEVLYPMIDTIIEYEHDVQLIRINCDYKTYVDHFDFPFCSSYYCNGKLYTKCRKEDLIKKKFTFNPDVILHQVTQHEALAISWLSRDVAEKLLARLIKYKKRGFNITSSGRDWYYELYLKLEKSVRKDCSGNTSLKPIEGTNEYETGTEKGRLELCSAMATYWTGFWDSAEMLSNTK